MQPLGRKKIKHFVGKIDYHLHKLKNWWENDHSKNSKNRGRILDKQFNLQKN